MDLFINPMLNLYLSIFAATILVVGCWLILFIVTGKAEDIAHKGTTVIGFMFGVLALGAILAIPYTLFWNYIVVTYVGMTPITSFPEGWASGISLMLGWRAGDWIKKFF